MMNKQLVCGCSTVFTVAFGPMLCFHPLFITVAPCPTIDGKRLHIFRLDCWVQQRPPFRWLVPEKQAIPGVVGRIQCFLSAFRVSSIADAHHFLDGTAMLAPQVMCCEPVRYPGQVEKTVGGIVGIAIVVCPSVQECILTREQVQFRDLVIGAQSFHFRFEFAFLFRRDAQAEPARTVAVALTSQVISQKAKSCAPMSDVRLFWVLCQPQMLLEPGCHCLFELLCFCL